MSWLKVDDKLTSHPKWVELDIYAASLWFATAVWCAAHNNDGLVPDATISLQAFHAKLPPDKVAASVEQLTRARLWRRRPKSAGGGYEIVNWLEYQPSRQQVKERHADAEARDARRELHSWLHKTAHGKRVKADVMRRDGGWCRYCNIRCRTDGDRRSLDRLTFDLVDPTFEWDRSGEPLTREQLESITAAWVVACGYCNAVKNRRTPDEAGLPLLPAQGTRGDLPRSAAIRSRSDRDPGTDQDGSGQVGAVRTGSDLAGSGQVMAGVSSPAHHSQTGDQR